MTTLPGNRYCYNCAAILQYSSHICPNCSHDNFGKARHKPGAIGAVVCVCREDNPRDVDEAYGEGTYARLFPESQS